MRNVLFTPLGDKIVFTRPIDICMRTWEFLQEVILNHSPVFNELYIMDSNGDNLTRLTDHDGYDGGPFFDSSGNHMLEAALQTDCTAEIFRMSVDGK